MKLYSGLVVALVVALEKKFRRKLRDLAFYSKLCIWGLPEASDMFLF
jgi:hypothetical protein